MYPWWWNRWSLCQCRVCAQKERFIQVSKVDEEERKRREQQKLEREQVWGPKLWMCLCWRASSCWCDCLSTLSRRSWTMPWASPESSTPFPSLWVQSEFLFIYFKVLSFFNLFPLTCRGNSLSATTCCWMWCTPSTSSTVLCQRCTWRRISVNKLLQQSK